MKLGISRRLLPLKLHYFLFQGSISPILPFIIIVAMHLGIPVSVQGTIAAISLLLTVLGKPVIAGFADTYPSYRKAIFLVNLVVMVSCYSSIWFIPPLKEHPDLQGKVIHPDKTIRYNMTDHTSSGFLLVERQDACSVATAWDCREVCPASKDCSASLTSHVSFKIKQLDGEITSQLVKNTQVFKQDNHSLWQKHFYQVEGMNLSYSDNGRPIRVACAGAEWTGDSCTPFWHHWEFLLYVILLNVAQITFNTGNSFTDAIVVDSMGENDSYGVQRAFGSLGWGVIGTLSGLLVDLWSGSSIVKNYSPAFLVCFILGFLDICTCSLKLQVPKLGEDNSNILKLLGPLLRQPKFSLACGFALFNGCFDGIATNFLFVLQEDIGQRTQAMSYVTFVQGISLLIQCFTESPFMFTYDWFLKKLGVQRILSLVFFAYMLRMWGLAIVGFYGPLWSTLLVEVLNGPCFGLGYTVTVSYAAVVSPPGTSTTVQSILNICFDTLGYALANFVGGILIDSLGSPMMFTVGGFLAATILILHRLTEYFFPTEELGFVEKAEGQAVGEVEG